MKEPEQKHAVPLSYTNFQFTIFDLVTAGPVAAGLVVAGLVAAGSVVKRGDLDGIRRCRLRSSESATLPE